MIHRDVVLEALGAICNAKVTARPKPVVGPSESIHLEGGGPPQLFVNQLISAVVDGDQTCPVARNNLTRIQSALQGVSAPTAGKLDVDEDKSGKIHVIDEDEFLDPPYDYDFTGLKDTQTYHRGGEKYSRPCGWQHFALKVLDKYGENTWLGNPCRTTESVPGEWPVSYHGTSDMGAEGIIEGHYEPGGGQVYGRGIYSTPDLSVAAGYAKSFRSNKTGKTYEVILQNRINPRYREKHCNNTYWLIRIPKGTSQREEQEMVDRAIRPYGLLLKEV